MKVIIDTNLWISFLIGHQTQLVRRMLTDLGQYHQTRIMKLADFKAMMQY